MHVGAGASRDFSTLALKAQAWGPPYLPTGVPGCVWTRPLRARARPGVGSVIRAPLAPESGQPGLSGGAKVSVPWEGTCVGLAGGHGRGQPESSRSG